MTDTGATLGVTPAISIVRVAILAGGRVVDVAIPAEIPLREVLPAVRRLVAIGEAEDAASAGAAPRVLSLAPIGGAPFSLDASLNTVGVVDGDLLVVQPIPAGPAAPGVIEDVADAAVIYSSPGHQRWGARQLQLAARAALIVLLLTTTGFCVAHHLAKGGVASLYVLSALAVVTVVTALLLTSRSDRGASAGIGLSAAALAPLAATFAIAIPGPPAMAQLMLAAAGVTAWSMVFMILTQQQLSFFTAVGVVGAGMTLVGAMAQLWQLPSATLGCALLAVALVITVQAAQLSTVLARLPIPTIPAPGDPAPPALELRALRDLPRRIRVAEAHQTGFIVGAVVLSVAGSLTIIGRTGTPGIWSWYAVSATAIAALLRARVWSSSACKFALLSQPVLLAAGLTILFVSGGRYVPALWSLVALAVLTVAIVSIAVNPKSAAAESYSLPLRRLLGLFAAAVDASLIPVLAYLVGLFSWVLER